MGRRKNFGIKSGDKFTYLTTLYPEHRDVGKSGKYHGWVCRCICGNTHWAREYALAGNPNISCGCVGKKKFRENSRGNRSKYKINVGDKFGKLLAVEESIKDKQLVWKFICDCGNVRYHRACRILGKSVQLRSCGCVKKEFHGEKLIEFNKQSRSINISTVIFHNYKITSEKRGREFSLSEEDFSKFLDKNCYYCGSPPSNKFYKTENKKRVLHCLYNGIDRINSKEGYKPSNCVSCCGICNKMKMDLDLEVFFDKISRIAEKHNL